MKLIPVEKVLEDLSISRVTLNTWVARAAFVQPVQVAGKLMFVADEVEQWIASQPRGLFKQRSGLKRHQDARRKT